MDENGSSFVLRLDGIKLPEEAEHNIASKLQAVFMEEIGNLDLRASAISDDVLPGGYSILILRKWWYGIWIDFLNRGKFIRFEEKLSEQLGAGLKKQLNEFGR